MSFATHVQDDHLADTPVCVRHELGHIGHIGRRKRIQTSTSKKNHLEISPRMNSQRSTFVCDEFLKSVLPEKNSDINGKRKKHTWNSPHCLTLCVISRSHSSGRTFRRQLGRRRKRIQILTQCWLSVRHPRSRGSFVENARSTETSVNRTTKNSTVVHCPTADGDLRSRPPTSLHLCRTGVTATGRHYRVLVTPPIGLYVSGPFNNIIYSLSLASGTCRDHVTSPTCRWSLDPHGTH